MVEELAAARLLNDPAPNFSAPTSDVWLWPPVGGGEGARQL
jgi:hypothetical protein